MSDDIDFNYIYTLVKHWFYTEDEVKRWYTNQIIPAYGMTPIQIVEKMGRDELAKWVKVKNLGSFE